jgi:hypothetical protein
MHGSTLLYAISVCVSLAIVTPAVAKGSGSSKPPGATTATTANPVTKKPNSIKRSVDQSSPIIFQSTVSGTPHKTYTGN